MSVRISEEGRKILIQAANRKGWQRQSPQWCDESHCNITQLKDVWAKKPVKKEVLQDICRPVGVDWREVVDYEKSSPEDLEPIKFCKGMPYVSAVYGRTEDLKNYTDWILNRRCQVLAIYGMGGVGKTALAVELTKKISSRFDYELWYSLASRPPLAEFLSDIFKFLRCHSNFDFTTDISNIDDCISQLIRFLNRYRCLLVLDGLEALLSSDQCAVQYQNTHSNYSGLIQRVGQEPHQSCLILTTREIPREIAVSGEQAGSVRTHNLGQLGEEEARGIFQEHRLSDEHLWKRLNESYRGNPLLLKIISPYISDMFGGGVSAFLRQGTLVTGNIETCLDQLFEHSSDLEKNILYILAERNEIVSCDQLKEILRISPDKLLLALESLVRQRSLVEQTTSSSQSHKGFTLAPVIKEYVSKRTR